MVFIICEFGGMMTDRFEAFNHNLCQCKWYLYTAELQRLYLLFVVNTQHPVIIRGYGNIICTRETFKKVTDALRGSKLKCGLNFNLNDFGLQTVKGLISWLFVGLIEFFEVNIKHMMRAKIS